MCVPHKPLPGPTDTPDLAGLLLDGLHRTLHGAEQRLDLTGRLLQEEAGDELVHVAPALVHLRRDGNGIEGEGRLGAGVCDLSDDGAPLCPASWRLQKLNPGSATPALQPL